MIFVFVPKHVAKKGENVNVNQKNTATVISTQVDGTKFWEIQLSVINKAVILIKQTPEVVSCADSEGKYYVYSFCIRLGSDQGVMTGQLHIYREDEDFVHTPDFFLDEIIQQLKWYVWKEINLANSIGELFFLNEIIIADTVIEKEINKGTLSYYCYEDFCSKFGKD